ncbi:GNAT family N-acetyltransferase [Acinetobacter sp. ULE_I001]|jgi:RimJ/RimL family protein N-acetyltransferase|uniref:GNAT family N-acetyltransferase n=1 Tax=unclassified Acinetobacter TaxID=196816 RepID=UPI00301790E0
MIYELCTDRLLLRQWQASDYDAFAKITANPEVMQFFPKILNREQSDELANQIKYLIEIKGWGLWAVELIETQEFIGCVGLHQQPSKFEFSPCIEIGWRLDPKFWNKGYATEAAQACLRFAFEELNFQEIVAFTSKHNFASQNVMKKIGMSFSHDFLHPDFDEHHPLHEEKLYRIQKQDFQFEY